MSRKIAEKVYLLFIIFILIASSVFSQGLSYPINKEIEKIAKKPCKGSFSFAVMSDNHRSNAYEFLLNFAKKLNVDFILNCGDFTSDGKDEEYNIVFSQVRKIGIPHFFAPGNHEYRTPEGGTSLASRRKYKKIFGCYDYYFDFCGWRFIGMENVALDLLTDTQLESLKQTLKGKETKTVIFMHYPPATIEKWEGSYFKTNSDKFLQILDEYKVRYAFFGHFHQYDRVVKGNTTYVLCPNACGGSDEERIILNDNASGGYYGLIYVTVDGDNVIDFLIKPNIEFQK